MIFNATKGQSFHEEFTFKNEAGLLLAAPSGEYRLTLERGEYAIDFTDLVLGRNSITWKMAADITRDIPYSTLYFTLYYEDSEIARGVLRVQ